MPARANPAATLFPLLLAGLLAGMTYWLDLASRPQAVGSDGKSRHDPDYIVEKFEVRRFDPDGLLQHTLVASQMRHYPDDDSTVVLAPRLTYHSAAPTYVSAREAQLDSEGKHVELIDDVSITRSGTGGKPESVLTTTRLHAWPDDETARTNEPVTITQGQTRVTGSQLDANNKTGMYVLDGSVRGVFFRNGGKAASVLPAGSPGAVADVKPANSALAVKSKPQAQPKTKPAAKRKAAAKPKAKAKPKPNPEPSR